MSTRIVFGPHHLVGYRYGPETASRGILFVHGWASNAGSSEEYAQRFAERGWAVLSFDMRAHGESPGSVTETSRKDWLDDVCAAYDQLAADVDEVVVAGSSFGGYLTACVTALRPASQVILRVPADYPDDGFTSPGQSGGATGGYDTTRAQRALADFEGEVLIVESEHDTVIPPWMVNHYVTVAKHGIHIIQSDAGHTVSKTPELRRAYGDIILSWLGESTDEPVAE